MALSRSARLPVRVTASRTLLDTLGPRFGTDVFTRAPSSRDARSPLALAHLQDPLQAGVPSGTPAGRIRPAVGPDGAGGDRLAPDTWARVSPQGTSCGAQRPYPRLARAAKQAARQADEPRERDREHANIRDAIALLERHGYRVTGPDVGEPSDG
ncbi:hypothetical protein WL99_31745 [Burkholderia cepacia]|uniref:hypothetical protein n=1 Tax=Burkholderia cepacia TaxID=292 RepID=UPI0007591313|nr:hypothetical protein [Burkholderia cepacia]KWH20877.1 hypothetical protein WL99_31745 [Burkholderia cepacia]